MTGTIGTIGAIGAIGVARVERSETRVNAARCRVDPDPPPAPGFAPLNPGYAMRCRTYQAELR